MSAPKYQTVYDTLLEEIQQGHFTATGQLPSESQLVARFQVSRPTAARALRELQAAGLVERRVGAGTFLVGGRGGTGERSGASGGIAASPVGLLIPAATTMELFERLHGELLAHGRACGREVLWTPPGEPELRDPMGPAAAISRCEWLIASKVSGVIFAPFEHDEAGGVTNRSIVEKFEAAGVEIVLLDRDLVPFPKRSRFDLVGLDNFGGGFLLAEHLLRLGTKRLHFVSRPFPAPTVGARAAGARAAYREIGHAAGSDFVQFGDPEDKAFVQHLISDLRGEGFICANDHTAALLLRTFERIGFRVPHDVRVVGFDDLKYATLLSSPLTTIHQPCRDLANVAWRTLEERMREPSLPTRSVLLNPQLIVRESCGAYKGNSPFA